MSVFDEGDTKSIADVLLRIIQHFFEGQRRELKALLRLRDRKFKELDEAHEFFASNIHQIAMHFKEAAERIQKTDNFNQVLLDLRTSVEEVNGQRLKTTARRRHSYEESRMFATEDTPPSIKVPNDVWQDLREFARVHHGYFEDEGYYRHALRRVLLRADRFFYLALKEPTQHRARLADDLLATAKEFEELGAVNSERWAATSRAYHKLGATLRKYSVHAD